MSDPTDLDLGCTRPRVSVVIPTRNRALLVVEAVESVLAQTFRDIEVIVCDDGSTDDTEKRLHVYGTRIRYLRQECVGRPGPPRNRGIEAARGEWIAFLDDDDLWEPEKLARQMEKLNGRPDVGIVYTDRYVLSVDGTRAGPFLTDAQKEPGDLLMLFLSTHVPPISTALVRRDLLDGIGGFDEALVTGEDLDLWLRLAGLTRAACIPEPLVLVRRQRKSLSERSGAVAFENAIEVIERRIAAGNLDRLQQSRANETLVRLSLGLAADRRTAGDQVGARRATFRALRLEPSRPSTWRGAARVWLGRRS